MAKDRNAVTCNGRTAFYACMYEDIRQCAMDCGWAVALHGSLASDMDIMAMPWVDDAVSFKEMVDRVSKLFKDNELSSQYVITYNEKPYNRVVATIPIFADFYLDISTITVDVVPKSEPERLIDKWIGSGELTPDEKTLRLIEALRDEAKRYERYYFNHEYDKLIGEAKAEGAREAIEEIELEITKFGILPDNCVIVSLDTIAELKKKFEEKYGGSQ